MCNYIFKICLYEEWKEALKLGVFHGTKADKKDGFIHFSTSSQLQDTLQFHYKHVQKLVLLKVNANKKKLIWEKTRNSEIFPHLYGALKTICVDKVYFLSLDENKNHIIPF